MTNSTNPTDNISVVTVNYIIMAIFVAVLVIAALFMTSYRRMVRFAGEKLLEDKMPILPLESLKKKALFTKR